MRELIENTSGASGGTYYFLKDLTKDDIVKLASVDAALTALAPYIKYLNPKAVSGADLSPDAVASLFSDYGVQLPASWVNELSSSFLAAHGRHILVKLGTNLCKAKEKVIQTLLKHQAAHVSREQLAGILRKSKLAHMITPKIFKEMSDDILTHEFSTTAGVLIRKLPDDVFANLNKPLHDDWFKYMTEAQMRNFQRKFKKEEARNILKLDKVGPQAVAGITPDVMKRYFQRIPSDASAAMKKDKFWKRINVDVFTKIFKDDEDGSIARRIPEAAYEYMTKEQRQAIFEALGKSGNCHVIPAKILKGKAKHTAGLTVSKKCFKSILDNAADGQKLRFRILARGATEAASAKSVTVEEVNAAKANLKRGDKDSTDLTGMCAYEKLKDTELGAEYVKNILKEDAEEKCKAIQVGQLRKAHWLQSQLNAECIQAIEDAFSPEVAKNMHSNMWAGFSKKQIKECVVDRAPGKWAGMRDDVYAGLARNEAFAGFAFHRHLKGTEPGEKSDDEEVEIFKVMPILKLPAEQVKKHFGAAFVKNVPEKHYEHLAEHIGLLADSALAGSDASFIRANLKADKITDAQFGHASDDVDAAGSYPASITSAEVVGLSTSRVAAFSPTFVSRLKAATIAAMSADQVAAVVPASLVNVCGDAAAAFSKHALSEAQKAELSSGCATGNAAPCPFSASSILAVAAAAAGSAALLL
jgi:hypothetical protein